MTIKLEIYDSFDELFNIKAEWDSFVEANGADIFMTFDWCRIWWKYYGGNRDLKIFIFRNNDELTGIIPIFIEKIWLGPIFVRVAKLVGSDFTLAQFTLPLKSEYCHQVIQKFLEELHKQKWNMCSLGPLSGFFHTMEDLSLIFKQCNDERQYLYLEEIGEQIIFELPDSWDEYLACLKKKERQLIRSNYRKIKDCNSELQYKTATVRNFENRFSAFLATHQGHWNRLGRPGHFFDWPCSEDFHREVAEIQLSHGRLQLLGVRVVEDCFAYQYSYMFGRRYFEILMGRSLSDTLPNIDLGRLLFAEQMQQAIEKGIENIDSMRGRYEHKLRLGGKVIPLFKIRIIHKGVFNVVRVYIFDGLARLLDMAYYKMWYCRIAPKLPFKRRPLWKLWIRTRL